MVGYRFQHLECLNPPKTDKIIVIGRCEDGKSIAVHVENFKPHVVVNVAELPLCYQNLESFEEALEQKFLEIVWTKRLQRAHNNDVRYTPLLYQKEYVNVIERSGQDIMNFEETGDQRFFEIYLNSKYDLFHLKSILSNKNIQVASLLKRNPDGASVLPMVRLRTESFDMKKIILNLDYVNIGFGRPLTIYNDQVNFMLQYFIDCDVYACSWIEVGRFCRIDSSDRRTSCDIEISVNTEFDQLKMSGDQTGVAPWRIFSYDIESLPHPHPEVEGKFAFPRPEYDPVVTIGGVLQKGSELTQYVWVLRENGDPVKQLPAFEEKQDCQYRPESTTVFDFDREADMLHHFFNWCVEYDVDIIQGHNVNRFDNTYMLTRYSTIASTVSTRAPVWGRLLGVKSFIEEKTFSSSQKGTNIQYKLYVPGRIVIDSYDIMKDQHNESSYKLDDLAQKYVGTNKVPMDYDLIYPKYKTLKGRTDLAVYCVKDAWLVYKLLDKLCKQTVLFQMSNVTGVFLSDIIGRGQGIRTIALMLRYARKRTPRLMLPRVVKKSNKKRIRVSTLNGEESYEVEVEESFKGAVVVDPEAGFYDNAVSCLDFASLYPSIMQCMNMSYETLVTKRDIEKNCWKQDTDVRTIPNYEMVDGRLKTTIDLNNPSFIVKEKRLGLLPEILQKVLAERKEVKRKMKGETPHSTMYKVYDGRQLGLKVVANSIYGFTGASFGFLPCKTIAESVTKFGRGMILQTKSMIENHPEWGRDGHGAVCIYGDTDSVFVHMPRSLVDGKDDEELMANAHVVGEKMANYITGIFLPPNNLEYEKSYSAFLLLCKKRYAGMKYEPGLPPKMQIKGLEAARRDFAPIVVDTQKKVLRALIEEKNKEKALEIVRKVVDQFYNNTIPLEMLIMSKKLSRPPELYKAKAPHVELTKKQKKKGLPHAVAGDRVQYFIHTGTGGTSDRACTPEDIYNGKYSIDRFYYLHKQLMNPITRVLSRVVPDVSKLFSCQTVFSKDTAPKSSIFNQWVAHRKKKQKREVREVIGESLAQNKQVSIRDFFK
jgi:DNA polymerase delta subunit 1